MQREIFNALSYATSNGYQVHPDAFAMLKGLDTNVLKIIQDIVKMKIKQKRTDLDTAYVTINISYEVPSVYQNFLRSHRDINGMLYVGIFKGKEIVKEFNLEITAKDIARQKAPFAIAIARWLPHGIYDIRLGIKAKNYLITHNSETLHVDF